MMIINYFLMYKAIHVCFTVLNDTKYWGRINL